jgi:outer membrane autotransporter protein
VPGSVATYGGVISGNGSLTIGDTANTGTVVFTADNTYSGATNVASGTLRAGSSTAFSENSAFTVGSVLDLNGFSNTVGSLSGTGTVTNNGSTAAVLTVGQANTNSTFGGILANGNAVLGLMKTGAGALTLTGNNTYSGGTVIDGGTLVVAGPQALGMGNLEVNGGILTGEAQPINVQGNYTQNAGGTLQLGVAGSAPGQYGFLNVGGHATLGGTLQLISLNGFQPRPTDQLTLVIAAGGLSGEFANVPDPFGPLIALHLIYRPNAVLLEFSSSFIPYAVTPNERAAANLVDAIQFNPKAAQLISFLLNQPLANLSYDLAQISPDALTAFYEISFSNANIQRLTLEGRLDDLRIGSNGFSSNMKLNGAAVNLEDKATADGKSSKSPVEQVLQPGPENRWGVWVTGFGDFVNVDGDFNSHGYDFTTGGFSVGVDYRITDQLAVGAMGEYAHTWTSLKPSGDIDVDSGRGGAYATWFNHGIYLNGAIYGGHNVYSSSRPTLGGMATGGTGGAEYSTFISGGYDFHCGHLTAGPIAALQYTHVSIDSFTEQGSLAPLDIHSQSAESLRSDFGFRASYLSQVKKVLVEPTLRAAWEHEYKYSALPMTAGFADIPGPSDIFYGPSEGHDSAIVSAGVSVYWTPTIATNVNYDGQLGRGRYDSNAVTGGVRITF